MSVNRNAYECRKTYFIIFNLWIIGLCIKLLAILTIIYLVIQFYPQHNWAEDQVFKNDDINLAEYMPVLTPKPQYRSKEFYKNIQEMLNSANSSIQKSITTDLLRPDIFGNLSKQDFVRRFIPEKGGNPLRSIIITSWRSGSTYSIRMLTAIPGTLAFREPLVYLFDESSPNPKIRGPPLDQEAIDLLKKFLTCQYSSLSPFVLDSISEHRFAAAPHIKNFMCQRAECKTVEYMTELCKLTPFQAMKIIRIDLGLAEKLLNDNELNIKLVYLVRDPRASQNSRHAEPSSEWCTASADCFDARLHCYDLVNDYKAAKRLQLIYPDRFRVIRYEDLVMNLYSESEALLYFLGFQMSSSLINFVRSTSKSEQFTFHWRHRLSFNKVMYLQMVCSKAMHLWGYKHITNVMDLNNDSYMPMYSGSEFKKINSF